MRAFSAEKMLLFAEVSAVVWLAGQTILWLLGKVVRRPGAEVKAVPAAREQSLTGVSCRTGGRDEPLGHSSLGE